MTVIQILKDFFNFLYLLVLVMFAFAFGLTKLFVDANDTSGPIASSASDAYISLDKSMVTLLWALFGQFDLGPLGREPGDDGTNTSTYLMAAWLFVAYLMLAGILLMNLMIAVLSGTYERHFQMKDMIYRYNFCELMLTYQQHNVTEYIVPLNILSILRRAFRSLSRSFRDKK